MYNTRIRGRVNINLPEKPRYKSRVPRLGTIIIVSDPYWIQALESIIHTSQKLGDELIVLAPAATEDDLRGIPTDDLVDQVLAHDLDVLMCSFEATPFLLSLLSENLPIVCLSEMDFHHPFFTAASSLYGGGKIAGEYIGKKLKGSGHAVCINAGLEKYSTKGQSRTTGFDDALQPFPEISIEHIPAYWSYNRAYPALLSALEKYPQRIDAIFGVSDTILLAARDAGRKRGVIDDHTILVGLNGDPAALAAVAEGDIAATIDTASEYLGAEAVRIAHHLVLGQPQPELIQQKFRLITRENVASVATRKLTAIADIPSHMVGYSREQESERLVQLEVSLEITQQIGSLQDNERVIQVISEQVSKYYGYEWVYILRWSKDEQKLVAYGGTLSPVSRQMAVEQDWLLNHAFRANEVIYIPDTQTSRRWRLSRDWDQIRSRALLPIQLGADVIGILDLQSSHPIRRPSLEIGGLKLLASQIGIVIQNADLYQEALQARATAERANQLKNRLMANVGHEMRTPLNSILGFSQSIQKQLNQAQAPSTEDLKQDIQHIYRSGEHLMYMINDLLDLSRAEIGALSLYFEQLDPLPFLNDLFAAFLHGQAASSQVAWHLDLPERLPVIRVDVVRLRQILVNLLVNAQKFTRQGSITLGAAVEPPHLHLWVRDTGAGVPMELQEKIFEPFVTTAKKRRSEGIGLGLSITRHLVALHGGIITLESHVEQGSTFNIYLPLPGVAQEPVLPRNDGGTPLMLVVSCRDEIPQDLQQICARRGLTACRVGTREDLAAALAGGKPVVVAWDMRPASVREWDLIQQLSANPSCAALPLILYQSSGDGQRMPGLTNVFFKPCSANTLKEWIGQIEPAPGQDHTILVVDDDPQVRAYYQKVLHHSQPKRRILAANDGRQALEILKEELPGLILLDLMMPEMDGFAVLEAIRADARTQRIPVIVISGKLLSYDDIQRLDSARTSVFTKGILDDEETLALFDQAKEEATPLSHPTSTLVKQVLAYIHQNYNQPVTRKDIAGAVGVSENYLSQIFHQEMTISPWDYLNRFRIQRAKELLRLSDETITQIAIRVGFNDSAYFSRVFRKHAGQSPLDYRKLPR